MSEEQKLTEEHKVIIKLVGHNLCNFFREQLGEHLLGKNRQRAIVLKIVSAIVAGFAATEICGVVHFFPEEEKGARLHAQKWMAYNTVGCLTDVLEQKGLTPDGVKQMEELVGEALLNRHGPGDDETKH